MFNVCSIEMMTSLKTLSFQRGVSRNKQAPDVPQDVVVFVKTGTSITGHPVYYQRLTKALQELCITNLHPKPPQKSRNYHSLRIGTQPGSLSGHGLYIPFETAWYKVEKRHVQQ